MKLEDYVIKNYEIIRKAVMGKRDVSAVEIKKFDPYKFIKSVDIVTNFGYVNVERNSRLTNLIDVGLEYLNLLEEYLHDRSDLSDSYINERLSKIDFAKLLVKERANDVRNYVHSYCEVYTGSNYS